MDREEFLYKKFLEYLPVQPTGGQDRFFRDVAAFFTCDDSDILVLNGYAGTGKTTAVSAIVSAMREMKIGTVLMAPTGRAAKVLSSACHFPSHTVHKTIYRQKSVGSDGFGQFTLAPNKSKSTLFIVDEVSLIGVESQERQSSTLFGSGNLLEDMVTYLRNGTDCRMIMIGDAAQLPPVGLDASPALSKDYMEQFGGVRFSVLEEVVRQSRESGILFNATMLRECISGSENGSAIPEIRLKTGGFDDITRIGGSELIECISDAYGKYGEDETIILCRSNKRAIRYNLGIRSTVQFKEERLVRGDSLMIVKNCYQFLEDVKGMDYIANGDTAQLVRIRNFEDRYGLHFAQATLRFPDYDDVEIDAKVCLDTLESESASLSYEQSNALYNGVNEDYSHIKSKKKRYDCVREDKYFNALQLKYANAVTAHKSQGGQWKCVFVDCPFWQDERTVDDLKWLYTALTRAVEKVYLVNFKDSMFPADK